MSRTRWLVVKLAVVGLATMLTAGIPLVEAPISGTSVELRDGTATMLVAGETGQLALHGTDRGAGGGDDDNRVNCGIGHGDAPSGKKTVSKNSE